MCSRLLVVTEEHFNEVVVPGISFGVRLPRLLDKQTLKAIEQVLEDAQPPHELESSQNAEEKIKCLFKPVLCTLGLEDTIITAAMSAYDNASNPNRTRGGLLKCDDMYVLAIPRIEDPLTFLPVCMHFQRLCQRMELPPEKLKRFSKQRTG